MARQKQQGTRNGTGSRRPHSVEDALAATQQSSVPILPAFGPPQQDNGSGAYWPAGNPTGDAPNTAYARGMPAPDGTTRQRTLGDTTSTFSRGRRERTSEQLPATTRDYTNYPSYGNGSRASQYTGPNSRTGYGQHEQYGQYSGSGAYGPLGTLPEGVADEVYDADTYEQDAAAQGTRISSASTSRALVPGRPTIGLPTLHEERLPATTADGASRQLALKSDAAESQALLIRGTAKPLKPYTPIVPKRHGPRSFMSQFIVAMVAVMTIFTVLTLASPLGHSEAFAGTFQTYANAVPWVPTPTPTPKPTPVPAFSAPAGANPGQQAVINDIVAIFGSYANGAINVARCESGFDPNAWNPYAIGGSHASGVFQILYPSTWDTTSWASSSPYNYDDNIRAAHQIFVRDGYSWREWSCGIYA